MNDDIATPCKACGFSAVRITVDFGLQPISNRFLLTKSENEDKYPLVLGCCSKCGTVQLESLVPHSALAPKYDWIKYSEPEPHLDALVDTLVSLPGINKDCKILGVSYKDKSTLDRLQKLGFTNIDQISINSDLKIDDSYTAGIETIQHHLTKDTAKLIAASRGTAKIVIARHILEHAHNLSNFLAALKELCCEDGYIVIEVPDEERALSKNDAIIAWEEHVIYFTPQTLRNFFTLHSSFVDRILSYSYPLEDSLVAIVQNKPKCASDELLSSRSLTKEISRFESFTKAFTRDRNEYHAILKKCKDDGVKIAAFGASHLTIKFINFYELSELIEFIVDDSTDKQSFRVPGSRLPIKPSSALISEGISLCLLGVNPANEENIIDSHKNFIDSGGKFLSIFKVSNLSVLPSNRH